MSKYQIYTWPLLYFCHRHTEKVLLTNVFFVKVLDLKFPQLNLIIFLLVAVRLVCVGMQERFDGSKSGSGKGSGLAWDSYCFT